MTTPSPHVEWSKLDQKTFDRLVEALMTRVNLTDNPKDDVQPIDGRGGDGGTDIDVRNGDHVKIIYQLKFFPEGFSGAWARARKPQITKSFNAAIKSKPDVWALVMPRNPTTGERDFAKSLKKSHTVKIRVLGQAHLDEQMARFPDLLHWATREPLVDTLRDIGLEKAALVSPNDQRDRIVAIQEMADSRSENWTTDHTMINGLYVETLRPKHAHAQEREPVGLTLSGTIDKSDPELFERARRVFGYGTDESITLPSRAIEKMDAQFPDFYSPPVLDKPFDVVIPPPASLNDNVEVEIRILDDDGFVKHSYEGRAKHLGAGTDGVVLKATVTGNVTFSFYLDHGEDGSHRIGSMDMSHDITGISASIVNQGLQFRRDLLESNKVEMLLDGNPLTQFATGPGLHNGLLEHDELLTSDTSMLVDDLAVVERELGVILKVPASLSNVERLNIRVTRLLLEGNVVIDPFHQSLTGVIEDVEDPPLKSLLAGEHEHPAVHDMQNTPVTILGKKLKLGRVRVVITEPVASNAAEILAAIRDGAAKGMTLEVRPPVDKGIKIFLPDRFDYSDESNPTIAPWGVDGIDEHPELRGITSPPSGHE
jgi:hypothetical protein